MCDGNEREHACNQSFARWPSLLRDADYKTTKTFEGVIPNLERRWKETELAWMREEIERFMSATPCPQCNGYRLKPESLAVKIAGKHIGQVSEMSIRKADQWFTDLPGHLSAKQNEIAARILKEIRERLRFLNDVGLDYLTMSRNSGTLSGRREPAHPPGVADRLRADRRALRARRAVDRPPPARQRPPARHAEAPARPRQHASSWSNTTRTRSCMPTTSSTSGRRRHPRRRDHRPGHAARTSWRTRTRSPANTSRGELEIAYAP